MVFEIIITILWWFLILMLLTYTGYLGDFEVDNKDMVQNNLIVYWANDIRMTAFQNKKDGVINSIWQTGEQLKNFKYISWEKATNFLQLDISKVTGKFTVSLSSPCKVTGVVYRENQTSYDVQLAQSLNKYTITDSANNWKSTYWDKRATLKLDDSAFANDFEAFPGQNKAYYFHANKELPIRQITFDSWAWAKDITVLMFLEPVEKWWTVIKRNNDWIASQWTAIPEENDGNPMAFKETAKSVYNQSNKIMHKEVRYIIASWQGSEIELRNFIVAKNIKSYWATNAENRMIVNRMSPLMFYINEFQDVNGWKLSWELGS